VDIVMSRRLAAIDVVVVEVLSVHGHYLGGEGAWSSGV
jgi:hypothetical protein